MLTSPWVNDCVSDGLSISEAVEAFEPNILLGLSTQPNIFDETVCTAMARINRRSREA